MAFSELIGALRVTLGINSTEFTQGVKKVRGETAQLQKNMTSLQGTMSGVGKAFAAFGGALAVSSLVAAGKRSLEYASSLGEVAQQLGVTTKDLQSYRYAATQTGISQDEMDKGLSKLSVTIGKAADKNKAAAGAFIELGVGIKNAEGGVITAGEAIPKIAEALSKIKSPAERARLEVELFGKTGQKLDPLLSGGAKGVTELTQRAEQLGLVLSDKLIGQADEAADKLAEVQQRLEVKLASVVAENATAITGLADAIGYLAGRALSSHAPLEGLMRIIRSGGLSAGIKSFFGSGADQIQAGSASGFLKLKQQEVRSAQAAYGKASAARARGGVADELFGGGSVANVAQARLNLAQKIRELKEATAGFRGEVRPAALEAAAVFDELPEVLGGNKKAKGKKEDVWSPAQFAEELKDIDREPIALIADAVDNIADKGFVASNAFKEWEFSVLKVGPAVAALQDRIDDLAVSINDEITTGLYDMARGFRSFGDVALGVLNKIGQSIIDNLSPSGSGGIGGVIANAISGAFGGNSISVGGGPGSGYQLSNVPGWASGGGGRIGGLGGMDRNVLSLNGRPIARVSRGEMLNVTNDNNRGASINQNIYFSGAVDVATQDFVVKAMSATKSATMQAIQQQNRRRG